jgi:hypothetical protein
MVYSVFGIGASENLHRVDIDAGYNVVNSIDNGTAYVNKHLINWGDLTPIIMTYVNNDGSVSICSVNINTQESYVYEYTKELNYIKTMKFKNPFSKFGAFAKDDEGNYYIFSAKDVPEGVFDENNMALVKYNSNGKQESIFYFPAQTSDGFSGVKIPFSTGSCRMEISEDWITVYFARQMFIAPDGLNHQASYGFMLNKNNFENISSVKMPYVSHSFNQYILPIENGFVFADQGDVFHEVLTLLRYKIIKEIKA